MTTPSEPTTPPLFRRPLVAMDDRPLSPEECQAFKEKLHLIWPHNPSTEELEQFALRAIRTIAALEEELSRAK